MTKIELGKWLQNALDLQEWRLNTGAPSSIVFSRKVEGGQDTISLNPKRGVRALTFGPGVIAQREYDQVRKVLVRVDSYNAKFQCSSYLLQCLLSYPEHHDMLFAEIINPSDFDPYLPTARAMVHEDVLPQLERYRYLGPLHERIAAADLQEIRSFMPSTGIGSQPHIAIIKHLVGAPDAAHYISDLIERLTAAGLNYTEDVERLENIQKVLSNVAPLSPQQIWGNHS